VHVRVEEVLLYVVHASASQGSAFVQQCHVSLTHTSPLLKQLFPLPTHSHLSSAKSTVAPAHSLTPLTSSAETTAAPAQASRCPLW
jgi:hypothetical protein